MHGGRGQRQLSRDTISVPMNLFDNLFLGPVKQSVEIKSLHFQSTVSL